MGLGSVVDPDYRYKNIPARNLDLVLYANILRDFYNLKNKFKHKGRDPELSEKPELVPEQIVPECTTLLPGISNIYSRHKLIKSKYFISLSLVYVSTRD
jgi:hypothetical protein